MVYILAQILNLFTHTLLINLYLIETVLLSMVHPKQILKLIDKRYYHKTLVWSDIKNAIKSIHP